jgi:hypothetical protein
MDTKFSVIMRAEEARKNAEEYRETAYQRCERFLINFIASSITKHAAEGHTCCRIHTSTPYFQSGITASKVMEHLASPLHQLGYQYKIAGDCDFDISWGKEKNVRNEWEGWEDEPF